MYAELELIVCPRCKAPKEKKEFGKDSTKAKGISCWCKICKRTWRAEHRKKNPEAAKRRDFANDLAKHYGITVDAYELMRKNQDGRCACCGDHESGQKRRLHVDHDHTTGEVRALLCTQCNPGLGYFGDSIERLQMAIEYLRKFKKQR